MRNHITDVHNLLVQQLERLSDFTDKDGKPMQKDQIAIEIQRANAVCKTASEITKLNQLTLDAMKLLPPDKRSLPQVFLK